MSGMRELRGKPVADALSAALKSDVESLAARGVVPTLGIVRVGARPDDLSYERGLKKRFEAAGAQISVTELPETCTQDELEAEIVRLNRDNAVHGILLFRPLPKPLSDEPIKSLIDARKDVDCMGHLNLARVFAGDAQAIPPCTPQAVLEILDHYGYELKGKKAVIVGRSMVLGKPLAMMLLGRHATVTVCHTRTQDLAAECRNADFLFACAGAAKMITPDFTAPHQVVIDAGINMDGDTLCGDVDTANVAPLVDAITPVPGGVGVVTSTVLLKHTVMSAKKG